MSGELLLVIGPPAVGKMTVGRAVCARSGFRLFHNHHTIEPLIEVFGHGTPAFDVLNDEFRLRVLQEAARTGTRLVFTFVWAVDLEADVEAVRTLVVPRGRPSGLGRRAVRRPRHPAGPQHRRDPAGGQAVQRDLVWSEGNVREMQQRWRMNTDPARPSVADAAIVELTSAHLRLDNTALAPDQVAQRALAWLDRR